MDPLTCGIPFHDDVRHIDQRDGTAAAVYVRVFNEDRDDRLVPALTWSPSMDFGPRSSANAMWRFAVAIPRRGC
jgi:hypothetical protein